MLLLRIGLTFLLCCDQVNIVGPLLSFFSDRQLAKPAVRKTATTEPELPRILLDTTFVPPTGRIIPVGQNDDLQGAINAARPGDLIALSPGTVFIGNFTLPYKSGDGWIGICSADFRARRPLPGARMTPQYVNVMPKILSPNADAAIETAPAAHHYRLMGLEIGVTDDVQVNYGIVKFQNSGEKLPELIPHDLIIDRCYIHGNATGDITRGIALNSASTAVIDSFLAEFHVVGFDAQAICGWDGPGPFKIVNNYIEGATENFMLGGSDPSYPGLVPSDVEFRQNYVYKPLRWKENDPSYASIHWAVKNLFELKNARRVWVDGNIFEQNWSDAQNGFAILFTPRNENGTAPWSVVQDITFTNNIVRHVAGGINLFGIDDIHPSQQSMRIKISNNLFDDVDSRFDGVDNNSARWGGTGIFLQVSNTPDVTVSHNTVLQGGNMITAYGDPSTNFVFTNNVLRHNLYGVTGDGTSPGNTSINFYFSSPTFARNIIVGGKSDDYPGNNFFPASIDDIGFVNFVGGGYRLSATSPYKLAGTDGKDLGCDFDVLEAATARVVTVLPWPPASRVP